MKLFDLGCATHVDQGIVKGWRGEGGFGGCSK